jgi:hypothetical protein
MQKRQKDEIAEENRSPGRRISAVSQRSEQHTQEPMSLQDNEKVKKPEGNVSSQVTGDR